MKSLKINKTIQSTEKRENRSLGLLSPQQATTLHFWPMLMSECMLYPNSLVVMDR